MPFGPVKGKKPGKNVQLLLWQPGKNGKPSGLSGSRPDALPSRLGERRNSFAVPKRKRTKKRRKHLLSA